MDYVLQNHRHFTGPDWKFYLVGPREMAKIWRSKINRNAIFVFQTHDVCLIIHDKFF